MNEVAGDTGVAGVAGVAGACGAGSLTGAGLAEASATSATSARADAPPEEASMSRTSAMAVIRLPNFLYNFFISGSVLSGKIQTFSAVRRGCVCAA